MDADSVSLEAQIAIEKLRKDSVADPIIQSDNGSSFIAMEFIICQYYRYQRFPHGLVCSFDDAILFRCMF